MRKVGQSTENGMGLISMEEALPRRLSKFHVAPIHKSGKAFIRFLWITSERRSGPNLRQNVYPVRLSSLLLRLQFRSLKEGAIWNLATVKRIDRT